LTFKSAAHKFNHMVESNEALDATFHALADPTRRAMLHTLSVRPHSVGELAAPFDISLAAASKHIKVLERAGLVRRHVEGRTHVCALDAQPLHTGMEWIRHYEQFWRQRLDVLEALLQAEDAARAPAASPPRKTTRRTPR
jgi:DNA-binding transcriptional ArsR family regulator